MDDCCWVLIVLCSNEIWVDYAEVLWLAITLVYIQPGIPLRAFNMRHYFFFLFFFDAFKEINSKDDYWISWGREWFLWRFWVVFSKERAAQTVWYSPALRVSYTLPGSMEPAKRLMENSSLCAACFANPEFSFMCSTSHACFIISLARNQVAKTCLHCIDKLCNMKTWKRNSYLERQIQHLMWEFP